MKMTQAEKIFHKFNHVFLFLFSFLMLFPVWHVLMYSLSDARQAMGVNVFFWPQGFSLTAYEIVFRNPMIWSAYGNTVFVVVIATAINLLLTFVMAYALAKDGLRGKTFLTFFIFFTMIFSGGLIPSYLVVKSLGLINTLFALILPTAVNAFYIFIVRTFIKAIPVALSESARIDGANEVIILFRIILPLSIPAMAVIGLMYGVGHWNNWILALYYINDLDKMTLQPILRQILFVMSSVEFYQHDPDMALGHAQMSEIVKMASVIVATLPIVMIYPFLQKYFVKGIMIGAVKG